jgi:hypothetical protein
MTLRWVVLMTAGALLAVALLALPASTQWIAVPGWLTFLAWLGIRAIRNKR